jgi:hypothetical protein
MSHCAEGEHSSPLLAAIAAGVLKRLFFIFSKTSHGLRQTGKERGIDLKRIRRTAVGVALVTMAVLGLRATLQAQSTAKALVTKTMANEDLAEQHRNHYLYLSKERSDRTGGHLWTERVAETEAGKIRMLIAEDGQPLAGDRAAAERTRLAEIAAHPDVFQRREQALRNDERHAKEMLDLLPKAFLFDTPSMEGGLTRIRFRPDPAYAPQSLEERVLHAMTGSVLIEPSERLHAVEGRLQEDVTIGFGLVATVKAGSNFATTRDHVDGDEWKTARLDMDVNGRAIFFKTIGKKEHAEHSEFKLLQSDITVPQAVEMLER